MHTHTHMSKKKTIVFGAPRSGIEILANMTPGIQPSTGCLDDEYYTSAQKIINIILSSKTTFSNPQDFHRCLAQDEAHKHRMARSVMGNLLWPCQYARYVCFCQLGWDNPDLLSGFVETLRLLHDDDYDDAVYRFDLDIIWLMSDETTDKGKRYIEEVKKLIDFNDTVLKSSDVCSFSGLPNAVYRVFGITGMVMAERFYDNKYSNLNIEYRD